MDPMNRLKEVPITPVQSEVLKEIKRQLLARFETTAFLPYGSAARGQTDEESDLDLLGVTSLPLTRFERHEITNIVFDVNLP
jgi:uncharacterized protein